MKSIQGFFSVLITITVFAACDVPSSSEDDFQDRRVGNFMLTSETTAEWVGSATKTASSSNISAMGDTIYYDQPRGNSLEIIAMQSANRLSINIDYTDSTITHAFLDSTSAGYYMYSYIDGEMRQSGSLGFDFDPIPWAFELPYSCDSTYSGEAETLALELRTDNNESAYSRSIIDVDGLYEAVRVIACE